MKIAFFGTPFFAASILEYLVKNGARHQVVSVVSKPDAPKGRGQRVLPTAVHEKAQELLPNVPFHQPHKASDEAIVSFLRMLQADIFVVVAYGEIIKKKVLEIPKYGCLNIHASLLPHLRGAAPIHRAIMQGYAKTGITIMRMDEGLDTGDMLLQKEMPIYENDAFSDVESRLLPLAQTAIVEALDSIEDGSAHYVPQNNACATFAPKILEKDLFLDPRENVATLHNYIRALSPKPGAYFSLYVRGKPMRLKILSSLNVRGETLLEKPVLLEQGKELALMNESGLLLFKSIQLEGRSATSSEAFLRGHPLDCLRLADMSE